MHTMVCWVRYFSVLERILWCTSVACITIFFFLLDGENYSTFIASILGTTSLILCAKGHPIGQLLMIIFSIFYGIISFRYAYYGEMLTYLGMTAPMAALSFWAWIRHPYAGNAAEVQVRLLKRKELGILLVLTGLVTYLFYWILAFFHTANLLPSTISVATSFLAAALTFLRSPYYALAYAANDLVLIVLWLLAARTDQTYFSVVVCFVAFWVNDLYGFIQWSRMQKRQHAAQSAVLSS